jgi:hypothetical protein
MQDEFNDIIYNFKTSNTTQGWTVVDDGVMGGLSKGDIKIGKSGNAIYSGNVSTDNNGGFSSLRYQFNLRDVSGYTSVSLRIKGDGKSYQFRIKSKKGQYYSYVSTFNSSGDWETVIIPFKDFEPRFRGRSLDMANYDGQTMEEVAFLIGNKVKESFELEIESIVLTK